MPKPFMGVSANGCHHKHLALAGATRTCSCLTATNPRIPSKLGLQAIGGMLAPPRRADLHHPRPTVNSYRRFLGHRLLGPPLFADWGYQNRTNRGWRVSAPGRFEYRSVGPPRSNPYLSFAAIIKAMDDGIKRNLDPGAAPRTGTSTRAHRGRPRTSRRSR